MTPSVRLIFADSERSADMLYATGLFVPDAFVFLREESGRSHAILSALEVDRARRVARVDQVHEWSALRRRFFPDEGADVGEERILAALLHEWGNPRVEVPEDFPLGLARKLEGLQCEVVPVEGAFWPQRAIKRDDEVAAVVEALRITGQGIQAGIERIRQSRIGEDGFLWVDDHHLTSEEVRAEIHAALVREGAAPHHTIVAGGAQGADPHEEGRGPLPARWPIIIDCFPRLEKNGYWGDMTRTVCRGAPPERLTRAWEAVRQAQEVAFAAIREGIDGATVHAAVASHLEQAGFPTETDAAGRQTGFFHGTGHGLGLEIHEAPRINRLGKALQAGQVVTVEPGLYYPDMGGVRLEDVVLVTPTGCRNLTEFPKFLEI
ncbi:MAG: aminopeptidase P family protein [Magnetococcales bacterium]|nr:aminopeptidase P family protein [Magnetococcales bacterium]